jgi:quinol-cytochrome oxidoreductase complex cytochrome b subunit
MATAQEPKPFIQRTWDYITETQIWKSIFRHGMPDTNRNRVLVVMTNVFLHLHPVKIRKSGIRLKFTWCMGGLTFFLFLVETFTGLLLMFYYRPTVAYAYMDIIDLAEQVPLGIMRELHRWGAHAMVITVWLHMFRVFMTGSYKPPREFNWNVGVILLVLTLLLSFTGYLLPWDQLALWAVTVGTNMMGYTPVFGNQVRFVLLGGAEIGTDTLLRWYVLHVLMLPFVIVIFMAIHFWRVRKDGGISGPL